MPFLLVNNPQDKQELVYVGEGGYYYDESRVLWDERLHGALPSDIQLGAMTYEDTSDESGNVCRTLSVDAGMLANLEQENAARATAAAQAATEAAAIQQAKTNIVEQTWNQLIRAERKLVLNQSLDADDVAAILVKYPQE